MAVAINRPVWFDAVMSAQNPEAAWAEIFKWLLAEARATSDGGTLQSSTIAADRLLAEAAWDLWEAFSSLENRTSQVLKGWWEGHNHTGRAVLILDALSLRELRLLLQGATNRGITPTRVSVTAAEVPTDTDTFAAALGATSRASLSNNGAGQGFILPASDLWTDVLQGPFEHCLGDIKPNKSLVLWHQWLDDLLHLYERNPEILPGLTEQVLLGDDFWRFVNKMRQGRRLIITGDHGYAVSELFSTTEESPVAKKVLQEHFGASRSCKAPELVTERFLHPLTVAAGDWHVVIGQRRWPVRSGFPGLTHKGLSLLEAAVPFIELPEVN